MTHSCFMRWQRIRSICAGIELDPECEFRQSQSTRGSQGSQSLALDPRTPAEQLALVHLPAVPEWSDFDHRHSRVLRFARIDVTCSLEHERAKITPRTSNSRDHRLKLRSSPSANKIVCSALLLATGAKPSASAVYRKDAY
jgi:hypothetical protein